MGAELRNEACRPDRLEIIDVRFEVYECVVPD